MTKDYMNILLADDDEDDRLFFTDAFEELKIKTKVSTCEDGDQLMSFLNNEDSKLPDVLFLDLNMPKKTGLECLVEIKNNPRLAHLVIAIYSTSSSEEDIENTFVQGANIYIKKPENFETLKSVLSRIVAINWQYQTNALDRSNFILRI